MHSRVYFTPYGRSLIINRSRRYVVFNVRGKASNCALHELLAHISSILGPFRQPPWH